MTAEQLTALLRPLPPRYYSIASSRKAVGEEAHLLVAALRYASHGRAARGRGVGGHHRAASARATG